MCSLLQKIQGTRVLNHSKQMVRLKAILARLRLPKLPTQEEEPLLLLVLVLKNKVPISRLL